MPAQRRVPPQFADLKSLGFLVRQREFLVRRRVRFAAAPPAFNAVSSNFQPGGLVNFADPSVWNCLGALLICKKA
jgi:hypothetical protein